MQLRPDPRVRLELLLASPKWDEVLNAFYNTTNDYHESPANGDNNSNSQGCNNNPYAPIQQRRRSSSNSLFPAEFAQASSSAAGAMVVVVPVQQMLAPPSSPLHSPTLAMETPILYYNMEESQLPSYTALNALHMGLVAETSHLVKVLGWDLQTMENEMQSSFILIILLYLVNNEP
jgi:hypothetical protein